MTRIMIVESSPSVAITEAHLLGNAGYEVVLAASAAEALAYFEGSAADVIVLEYELPDMDGLTLLRVMRQRGVELPAVMVSGLQDPQVTAKAMQHGVSDYLIKAPEAAATLSEAVGRALEQVIARERGPDGTVLPPWDAEAGHEPRDCAGDSAWATGAPQEQSSHRPQESDSQAQQVERLATLGTMVGGIAHELGNLLMPVIGFSELLCRELGKDRPERASVERIHETVQLANQLVGSILTLARRGTPGKHPMDLHLAVAESMPLVRAAVPSQVQIHKALQPAEGAVLADPVRIQSLLLNLCINAGHAMPDGGELYVETDGVVLGAEDAESRGVVSGPYARLSVRDTGVGIASAVLEQMFEPYFTTRPEGQGTGLGLHTVRMIVRECDGFLEVDSVVGSGSTFRICLPCVKPTR